MLWARKSDCVDTFGPAQAPNRGHAKRALIDLPRIVVDTVLAWQERSFERRALRELDDRLLKDIGLTPLDADREARKPFWRS